MNYLAICTAAFAIVALADTAAADHRDNLATPYASRGECEAAVADFSSNDRDMLLDSFPNFFSSEGEVASFLTRAFPCEVGQDGQWHIFDRRLMVVNSEWFQRRLD